MKLADECDECMNVVPTATTGMNEASSNECMNEASSKLERMKLTKLDSNDGNE